jgi:hypothetical protein
MAKPITQRAGTKYESAPVNQEVTVDAEGTKPARFERMTPLKQTAFSDIKIDDTEFNYTPGGYTGLNMNAQLPTYQANQTLMGGGGATSSSTLPSSEDTGENKGESSGKSTNDWSMEGMRQNYLQTGAKARARMQAARDASKDLTKKDRKAYLKEERTKAKAEKRKSRQEYSGVTEAGSTKKYTNPYDFDGEKGMDLGTPKSTNPYGFDGTKGMSLGTPLNMWGNAKIQFGRKKNK